MNPTIAEPGIRLVLVAAALVAVAAAVSAAGHLGHAGGVLRAALRAAVQLTAVSALVTAVLMRLGTSAAFVALMLTVAVATSARRASAGRSGWWVGVALDLTDTEARREVVRPAAADAMLPALDQTRTVGVVTLPGAFVGMLLGGASAVEAGSVQLLVLLAAEAIAVVGVAELVASGRLCRPRQSSGRGSW